MAKCEACIEIGLHFDRKYEPSEFIEGDPQAGVWIIGINPARAVGDVDPRTTHELRRHFDSEKRHRYFGPFRAVSTHLHEQLGSTGGVAHTDLVKCFSPSWPPKGMERDASTIMANCAHFLRAQLIQHAPKVVICNGVEVSKAVLDLLPPKRRISPGATKYVHRLESGRDLTVVMTGYIGRIDNFSRRRLGLEIESVMRKIGLL